MKNKVYQELSDKSKATIEEYFGDFENRTEEGLLFQANDVKWYHNCYADLMQLYTDLSMDPADDEDFLLLTACNEYPDDRDADIGCWDDNPWDINKQVSVTLEWYPR
jgi:hypothetical protein